MSYSFYIPYFQNSDLYVEGMQQIFVEYCIHKYKHTHITVFEM